VARPAAKPWDGYNPLAVIDAYRRKKKILEEKRGPVLLDVLTYRYSGHSPSDASSYRSKEEVEAWESQDSIVWFGNELVKAGIATKEELEQIKNETESIVASTLKLAIDDEVSPHMDMKKHPNLIGEMMFSDQSVDKMEDREPEVNHPLEENPRVKQLANKERFMFDENGKPHSKIKTYALRDGLFEAIIDRFVKKTATGAVRLPFTAGLPKHCLTTGYSTRPFLKAPLWERPLVMPCVAAG